MACTSPKVGVICGHKQNDGFGDCGAVLGLICEHVYGVCVRSLDWEAHVSSSCGSFSVGKEEDGGGWYLRHLDTAKYSWLLVEKV